MIQLERFDVVLILADESDRYINSDKATRSGAKEKDSQSVATLLLTRDIRSELKLKRPQPILAEILDSHTKHLLASHSQEDCVTSNELISKAMAMISERSEVATSAINGTTQMITIKASTTLLKVRFIIPLSPSIT